MTRLFVDCRDYPSEMNCTVAISADTKEELVDAAVQRCRCAWTSGLPTIARGAGQDG